MRINPAAKSLSSETCGMHLRWWEICYIFTIWCELTKLCIGALYYFQSVHLRNVLTRLDTPRRVWRYFPSFRRVYYGINNAKLRIISLGFSSLLLKRSLVSSYIIIAFIVLGSSCQLVQTLVFLHVICTDPNAPLPLEVLEAYDLLLFTFVSSVTWKKTASKI